MSSPASQKNAQVDFLADALAYIEAHLFDALSLAAIADAVGLSPFHFARAFSARFGESVIAYVRQRRMLMAAQRLQGDRPPPLAQLAFDCGFESQEAFTRAFRREFGHPPGKFRRAHPGSHPLSQETTVTEAKTEIMQLPNVRREAFTVAGVAARFDESNKSGIPALWPRLIQALPLAGQVDGRTYGPCWSDTPGQGWINYMAGVEVTGDAALPQGFTRLAIAAQSYLVFRQTLDGTALHPQMQAGAKEIWGTRLPKLGAKLVHSPDFELYPDDFNPMRKGAHVDVYVAVAG